MIYKICTLYCITTSRDAQEELNIRTTLSNKEAVEDSEVVIVAVKPHIVSTVLKEVSSKVTKDQLIISLAAGTRLKTMSEVCILHKRLRL